MELNGIKGTLNEKIYRKLKKVLKNWDIKSSFGKSMCPAM